MTTQASPTHRPYLCAVTPKSPRKLAAMNPLCASPDRRPLSFKTECARVFSSPSLHEHLLYFAPDGLAVPGIFSRSSSPDACACYCADRTERGLGRLAGNPPARRFAIWPKFLADRGNAEKNPGLLGAGTKANPPCVIKQVWVRKYWIPDQSPNQQPATTPPSLAFASVRFIEHVGFLSCLV